MKKIILFIFALILAGACYFIFLFEKNDTPVNKPHSLIQENEIPLEEAQIKIVTFGERIKDERAYFYQWEAQSEETKKQLLDNETFFMFSVEEYKKEENKAIIKSLIESRKTILFYGYKIDVKNILGSEQAIPYYQIVSNKDISSYLYGYGYSIPSETMIPITVMGNFEKKDMDRNIINYLISHIEKHLTD